VRHAWGIPVWLVVLASVMALAAVWGFSWDAATRKQPPAGPLLAAEPAPNAILTTAPEQITLTLAQPIAPASASVQLLRAGNEEVALSQPQVDAKAPTRIVTRPEEILAAGDYVVIWSARADDAGLLSGSYPFRVRVAGNPGAASTDSEWPRPWAPILRWLVFIGAALAGGGFVWARALAPRPSTRGAGSIPWTGAMVLGALLALAATALLPLLDRFLASGTDSLPSLAVSLRAMSLGWWVQLVALAFLTLLCLGALARGRAIGGLPIALIVLGVGSGLAALAGLSLTSRAAGAEPLESQALALEIAHQWSSALWISGLLYLVGGWRGLGTDVARFRTVRWVGGVFLAVSVGTGVVNAWWLFPSVVEIADSRYGQVLSAKSVIVLVIVALGLLAMAVPRRSNAVRASWSLNGQGVLALAAALLAALLALMAAPGAIVSATLAGVNLVTVAPVDRAAFAAESGMVHLLTQPAAPGRQLLVVRLTDSGGAPLVSDPAPRVDMTWTAFSSSANDSPVAVTADLQPDASGSIFTGEATLATAGWWQTDIVVTPGGGIASRAQFWLILPDPNVTGRGPVPETDSAARALFGQGLQTLTALRSVRYTRQLGDGAGSLTRSQVAVSAAEGERPAAYAETVIDADGIILARQTMVGDSRWVLAGNDWVDAAAMPFTTPAAWGDAYADAAGFQLGPRQEIDGEVCQVVTFWQPPRADPSRPPEWFAWWIGLASGEMRQEAMISTRHYMVSRFRDFDAPLDIVPPIALAAPGSPTPAASPIAAAPS
jgi:copper transport protein